MLPLEGRAPNEWLFTNSAGRPLNANNWRARTFRPATARAGQAGMHPHELRHTAASLAIQSGADVKVVQRMLGHKSATLTLDVYGHLFDTAFDDISVRVDAAQRAHLGRSAPAEGAIEAQTQPNYAELGPTLRAVHDC